MRTRRGEFKPGEKKISVGSTRKHGPKPVTLESNGMSSSESKLLSRGSQTITGNALNSVSDTRRESLIRGTAQHGASSTSPAPLVVYSTSFKETQENLKKYAGISTLTTGSTGGADVIRQAPEVYSPLFQMANLQLPRDRITMNAWNRNFYDTNPLVHNCINLHSTYPIGKLNIRCKHKKIQQFFSDMIEEIDLVGILHDMATEFWKHGEVFPRADLDENRGIWRDILIQNPDYIHVKRSVLGGEPVISLRPDAALLRLVQSNHPSDIKLRSQIDEEILYYIRKGNNIPLDNFHISHLKMTSSPYDIRGTSIIVSIYKDLMLYDKLRESKFAQADSMVNPITLVTVGGAGEGEYHPTEDDLEKWRYTLECHDEQTEVFTNHGFKKFDDVVEYIKLPNGSYDTKVMDGIEIACFNNDNEQLEFHAPSRATLYDYQGPMYHFKNTKMDIKVTPNHDMWVSKKQYNKEERWAEWEKIPARDVNMNDYSRFRSGVKWEGKSMSSVNVLDKEIPIKLYLEFLGYVLSEGCLYEPSYMISLTQTIGKFKDDMAKCIRKFASYFDVNVGENFRKPEEKRQKLWSGRIHSKELFNAIKNEVCSESGKHKAHDKRVPKWILELKPELLKILLDAMVKGDGSQLRRSGKVNATGYYTTSKQMADDVYEMAYKCGFVPTMFVRDSKKYLKHNRVPLYTISWSDTSVGNFPMVYKTFRNSQTKEKTNMLNIVDYKGKVWCFTVPTGLFITRRNGKITIQGNSAQYDKDFKIISHAGVDIKRIGASGATLDISGDMNFIIDNILYGLMTPKAVLTQEGSPYSSASVGLEVLKQRYESFRNMIARWLKVKIFAPISEIQEFYEYSDGIKKLIVPDIDWNQMILFDMSDYVSVLQQLTQPGPQGEPPKVSNETLFRSLGIDPEEERRKVRKQMVQDTIALKEKQIAQQMTLSALRAVKEDEDLVEPTQEPIPGVPGADVGMGMGGMGGGLGLGGPPIGGGGGLGLGGPPIGGGLGGGAPLGGPPAPEAGGLGGGAPGGAGETGGAAPI